MLEFEGRVVTELFGFVLVEGLVVTVPDAGDPETPVEGRPVTPVAGLVVRFPEGRVTGLELMLPA